MSDGPHWLPDDPAAYIHPEHYMGETHLRVDWPMEYGRRKHFYLPGISAVYGQIQPGMNDTDFSRLVQPIVPVAARLVPNQIKTDIQSGSADDWTMLPTNQIRHVCKTRPVLFCNAFLTLICFQIVSFAKNGLLGDFKLVADKAEWDVTTLDEDKLLEVLQNLDVSPKSTLFSKFHIVPAVFRLSSENVDVWNAAQANPDAAQRFRRATAQVDEFVKQAAAGRLMTIFTAHAITRWYDHEADGTKLHWSYHDPEGGDRTAITAERVAYYKAPVPERGSADT